VAAGGRKEQAKQALQQAIKAPPMPGAAAAQDSPKNKCIYRYR
jgi:hypothetical protein